MQTHDVLSAPAELKFADGEDEGTLTGLASVFGNLDSHEDVVQPGAFADSLAQHKASGTMPRMFVEHSKWTGGDPLPIGVWSDIAEEARGLRVKGKLIGMTDPTIKRIYELVKARALPGLSIAFTVPKGGAIMGTKSSEPRRTLVRVNLHSVDLVGDPSNPRALVESIKSMTFSGGDQQGCQASLAKAIALHRATMGGGNSPTSDQRGQMLAHLQDAHQALTGQRMPPGMKSIETIRELEAWLHDPVDGPGWSISKARALAASGFKAAMGPRDGDDEPDVRNQQEALDELKGMLDGFSLSSS